MPGAASLFDEPGAPALGPVQALLFDLGGVLVELDWEAVFAYWAGRCGADPAALRERFAFDAAYERHERGEIAAGEYFEALRARLGIALPDADFHAGWNRVFAREIAPTVALLRRIDPRMPLYLFSNTNAVHHAAWSRRYAEALAPFREVFVSSGIGMRKPQRAAFEHVANAIGAAPSRILFFDDSDANVAGARAAGMRAVHVRSPRDVERAVEPWLIRR